MPGRAFIIGGTGQIGRAAARALLDAGWSVTLAHRGHRDPPADLMARGARGIVLDRKEPGALGQALGHGADVLIDTVAYGRDDADQLLALEGDVGGLVVVSSASVYRDAAGRTFDEARQTGFPELPDPIPETHPTVAPGPETYSTRKIALERRLLDGAKGPVTVLRPCAIHGPHSRHPREWWFVKRMLDGRRQIPLAYSGNSRFHTTATVNLAAAIVLVADRRGTLVMNVGDPTPLSVMEIGRVIAGRLGYSGSLVAVPDLAYPPAVGATPWSTPRPVTLDMSAAATLGYRPVADYADAAATTVAWLAETPPDADWKSLFPVLAGYRRELFDYAAEDCRLAGTASGGE